MSLLSVLNLLLTLALITFLTLMKKIMMTVLLMMRKVVMWLSI